MSIDNSRRVRELSHDLQFELLKSARKRMEKYMPRIVGSWLGGTYDRDRAVARAATDGTRSFLDTQAKMALFYKRCEVSVLEYAQEALEETPQTLSDERTMNADDVRAKYFRVIGSSLSLIANLLATLDKDDILKHQHKYVAIISGNKKLWSFITCEDAFVRRATAQLLAICLAKLPVAIEADLKLISHAFIAEGLKSSQTASAFQLLHVLSRLNSMYPEVWTSFYKAKKDPFSKLCSFVEKGSQGGPPEYWTKLGDVVSNLPEGVLPSEPAPLLRFLTAFRNGMSNREEPRTNAPVAWATYFDIADHFISLLSPEHVQETILPEGVFPVFEQYLYPDPTNNSWAIGGSISTLAKALRICLASKGDGKTTLGAEWARLEKDFVSKALTSLPEQSKEYHASQAAVVSLSHRWFKLVAEVILSKQQNSIDLVSASSRRIVKTCLESIVSRNGKPYSATATVEAALRLTPAVVESSPETLAALKSFLEDDLPKLILSPSGPYLISILNLFRSFPDQEETFNSIWESTVDGLLALPNDASQYQAIAKMLASDAVSSVAQQNDALQTYVVSGSLAALKGNLEGRAVFEAAVTFNSLSSTTSAHILNQILASLDTNSHSLDEALDSLEFVSKCQPNLLKCQSDIHVTLITKLLGLTELTDSRIATRATNLRSVIEKSISSTGSKELQHSSIVHVIRENLETAGPQSLS